MAEKKRRLSNVDFIRTVCALGIVVYHFSGKVDGEFKPLRMYANGNIGGMLIEVFFIISGAMLYLNNKEIPSLRVYFYKRFKSIYPSFYIAFFCFYIINVINYKKLFYHDCSPFTLIFSVLGIDGYLLSYFPNYYLLGEWFLGAIIILYVLYPLLRYGIEKHTALTTLAVTAAYTGLIVHNIFQTSLKNILSCMMSFYIGMLLQKYEKILKSKISFAICGMVFLILAFYKLPFVKDAENVSFKNLMNHIMGLCLFTVLYHIGELLTKPRILAVFFEKAGALSYPVYLLHHRFIIIALSIYKPDGVSDYFVTLIPLLAVTLTASYLLKAVTQLILKSKPCKRLERAIIKKGIPPQNA